MYFWSKVLLLVLICLAGSLQDLEAQTQFVPPWAPNPEKVRPMFRFLRDLKGRAEQKLGAPLPQLSMGMSGDFEVAIEEGATMVRIGTALFGERPKTA